MKNDRSETTIEEMLCLYELGIIAVIEAGEVVRFSMDEFEEANK